MVTKLSPIHVAGKMTVDSATFKTLTKAFRRMENDAKNGDETSITTWIQFVRDSFFTAMMESWANNHPGIANEISNNFVFDDNFLSDMLSGYIESDYYSEFKFIVDHMQQPARSALSAATTYALMEGDGKYLDELLSKFVVDFDFTRTDYDDDISTVQQIVSKNSYNLTLVGRDTYRISKRRKREDNLSSNRRMLYSVNDDMMDE